MGLWNDPKTWDLQFNNRTDTERDQIRAFLEARAGAESFSWTTPWNQADGRWVCEEWNIDPTNCNNNQIRAKFRQVYDFSLIIETDPYFSSNTLLLHMDGSNGSTVFTDSSPLGLTVTGVNGASIATTANSRSNGTAADFTSTLTNRYVLASGAQVAQVGNFGTGDFTIELTQYSTNEDTTRALVTVGDYSTAGGGFYCWLQGSTPIFTANSGTNYTGTPSAFANTLNHIAFTRSSGVLKIWVNGSQVFSGTMTANFAPSGSQANGGAAVAISNMQFHSSSRSYIDEVRITKGICRYNSAFTPPTGPFPDS